MSRKFVAFAVVCAIIGTGLSGLFSRSVVLSAPQVRKPADEKSFRPNAIIIKPKAGTSQRSIRALHASAGATVSARFPDLGDIEVLELPQGLDVGKALDYYNQNPNIEYAEPDYIVTVDQETKEGGVEILAGPTTESSSSAAASVPSDLVSNLWGMNNTGQTGGKLDADIDAPEAWNLATDASTVVVGVIDTGIDYTHPDLAANMWINPGEIAGNGLDDDGNGYVDDVNGINAILNTGDPRDDHYHGTHVSGTIGGVGNNGIGVVGVAWNVKLMGLKFLNSSGAGATSDAIKCINYGRLMGAKILSNSWGGGGFSQALYDAINAANLAGVVFVAAAGNSGADNDAGGFYPANYSLPNVIAVASSDANDLRSGFSNYGYRTVEIAAPGSNIYSTYPNGTYSNLSGTSMATPHVSGALALLRAYRPELTSPTQLINRIVQSSDALPAFASNTFSGGRLNLYNALAGVIRPIPHFNVDKLSGQTGDVFTFTDDSVGFSDSQSINYGDGSPVEPINGSTTHSFSSNGTFNVTLTLTSGGTNHTRTRTIVVQPNYNVSSDVFSWVDTTGLTSLTLTDDSASGAIALPFAFPFYGSNYSTLYVGSNGLLTLGNSTGATAYSNVAIPSTGTPNAAIYPYWDDLNPASGGNIKYGNTPAGFVVSYEGIAPFSDTVSTLTFQVILTSSGVVKMQYLDVKSNTTYGGGKSATVGIEDSTGVIGKQYSYLGSPLLANNTSIKFVSSTVQGPAAPSNLSAVPASSSQINLSWNDNASTETGYQVESSSNGSTFSTIASLAANSSSYQDTGLAAGAVRYYRVRANNDAGGSSYSNTANATTFAAPTAPSSLTATAASSSQVNLSWIDNATNEGAIEVERSNDNIVFSNIANLTANSAAYSDTGRVAGTLYYYRVRATNNYGASTYSNTSSVTTLPDPPTVATGFTATAISSSQINLAWTDNSNNEQGFKIEQRDNLGNFFAINTVGAGVQAYSVTGLASLTSYTFRVVAYNAGGSTPSASANATTAAPLGAPTGLTATATTGTRVDLTWAAPTGATSYIIQRLDSKTWRTIASGVSGTGFSDTSVRRGTKYSYRVAATSTTETSGFSNTVTVTTPR